MGGKWGGREGGEGEGGGRRREGGGRGGERGGRGGEGGGRGGEALNQTAIMQCCNDDLGLALLL